MDTIRKNLIQYRVKSILCISIILLFIFLPVNSIAAPVLPQERSITWEGNVGVEGGIPNRLTICNCVTDYNAHADGSDTSSEIQACIDNTPSDGIAYLPAGTYRLSSSIRLRSNKTLRGAGIDSTVLLADEMSKVVYIGTEHAPRSAVDIQSGYTKGSTQLVLANAGSINTGSYVRVDELNDASIPVTMSGVGNCTWCGRDQGTRVRGQLVKVIAKNGNTITIDPAMYFTFSASNIPQVQPVGANTPSGMSIEYAGIEDLTIKNNGTSYKADRIPLRINLAANCWAKNIRIENSGSRCVDLFNDNFRFELRDSIISGCLDRYNSNSCYGTLIGMYNSGVLIENNIYESVATGPMLTWGSSGNVVGYNYIYDAHRTMNQATWFMGFGISAHGAHSTFNLLEGNEMENAYFDQYWGSHSHNTLFRNRILGRYMVDGIADDRYIRNVVTIATETNVHYQNYVGNVLGAIGYHDIYERNSEGCPNRYDKMIYRTGYDSQGLCTKGTYGPFNTMLRHMNYDYVTNSIKYCDDPGEPGCQGWSAPSTLPASLYLSSKPSWFGAGSWPPIGPDLSPMSSDIPAKLRFNGYPTVSLSANPTDGNVPLDVSFNATASDSRGINNGTITKYEWDFEGDSNYDRTTTTSTTLFTYTEPGRYTAKLRVTDNDGLTAIATVTVTINSIGKLSAPYNLRIKGISP